jgi:RHS repeat-associated protein
MHGLKTSSTGGRIVTQKINAATSVYRYDLTDQLTNSTGSATYSASYDAVGNRLTADGIDQAGLMRAGDDSSDGVYALITDHLSSVVAILDSNGDLVETYEYPPFGKTTIKNSSGTVISESVLNNVLGFTGREFDTNTGLYYYRARWYSPDLGRFLEPDPIGLRAGDLNLYRYVGNEPGTRRDPDGLLFTLPELVIVVVVIGSITYVIWKVGKKGQKIGENFSLDKSPSEIPKDLTDVPKAYLPELGKIAVGGGGAGIVVKPPPETVKDALKDVLVDKLKDEAVGKAVDGCVKSD